jgi:hypothetical protein
VGDINRRCGGKLGCFTKITGRTESLYRPLGGIFPTCICILCTFINMNINAYRCTYTYVIIHMYAYKYAYVHT